jgi:RNA polymerase-interacting CarD/CdnL/TRCF family regulator
VEIKRKFSDKETYEEVIWVLVGNSRELSEKTNKEIALARAELKEGKIHSLAEVKKELE